MPLTGRRYRRRTRRASNDDAHTRKAQSPPATPAAGVVGAARIAPGMIGPAERATRAATAARMSRKSRTEKKSHEGRNQSCNSGRQRELRGQPRLPTRGNDATIAETGACQRNRHDWLAGAPGFEPGITGPKPVALPLGHAPPRHPGRRSGAASYIGSDCRRQRRPPGPGGRGTAALLASHGDAIRRLRRLRSVAQPGSAPRSGRGGRRFKSCHSDQHPAEIGRPSPQPLSVP